MSTETAEQAIRIAIFSSLIPKNDEDDQIEGYTWPKSVDASNIDAEWQKLNDTDYGSDWLSDAMSEFRSSGTESGLRSRGYSRHYECDEVAAQLADGRWVGWTYWHGGGKHGEPGAIGWIDCAYFLTATETTVRAVVMTRDDGESGRPIVLANDATQRSPR
jgi:hypothetical protein